MKAVDPGDSYGSYFTAVPAPEDAHYVAAVDGRYSNEDACHYLAYELEASDYLALTDAIMDRRPIRIILAFKSHVPIHSISLEGVTLYESHAH